MRDLCFVPFPGVAEINSTGGYVKQYQVLVDPYKLRYYDVTIHDVQTALARNNANSSGGILPRGPEILLVRGVGLIKSLDDIRSVVLKEVGATPVYIRDVAEVKLGEEVRYGAMIKGGYTEAVGGIIMMIAGGNAKEIVSKIKARVEEINSRGHASGRSADRSLLRSFRTGGRCSAYRQQGSDGGCGSCRRHPVSVSWGPSFQRHRHRNAGADAGADVSGDESLRDVGEPDVARRTRYRDRTDGRRVRCGCRERVREARPFAQAAKRLDRLSKR